MLSIQIFYPMSQVLHVTNLIYLQGFEEWLNAGTFARFWNWHVGACILLAVQKCEAWLFECNLGCGQLEAGGQQLWSCIEQVNMLSKAGLGIHLNWQIKSPPSWANINCTVEQEEISNCLTHVSLLLPISMRYGTFLWVCFEHLARCYKNDFYDKPPLTGLGWNILAWPCSVHKRLRRLFCFITLLCKSANSSIL